MMPRPILNARLHLIGLILVWAGWMFTTGLVLARLGFFDLPLTAEELASASVTLLLTALAWALLTARLPELARGGRLWAVPWVTMSGFFGLAGLGGAIAIHYQSVMGQLSAPDSSGLMIARGAFGILGLCLVLLAPSDAGTPAPFFLFSRQASDVLARRNLLASVGQGLLITLAITVYLENYAKGTEQPRLMVIIMVYMIGMMATVWQRYPQRLAGFIPIGWILASVGFLGAWAADGPFWSEMLLGFGLGLVHTPPRNDLLTNLPDSQRAIGLMVMAVATAIGAAIGIALIAIVPPPASAWAWYAVCVLLAALAVYGYFRELLEQLVEPLLAISYRIRGYGPGMKIVPTRGPVLVLANHCAWLDPLWVAKLTPLRMRPLMTSRFYDKPLISWLMRRVFHTIRVAEVAFRREAPEIQEAIAALDRGENVLIFPEGWLKRKEEQTMRRFGQGIYQILREKPNTPVVACWIEGGWGSYMSFKGGPPTVNKKPDFLRLIRIGISEPEVLSLDLLHDGLATRRHLMLKCLHARTYLGLPELPPPPFAQTEDSEESS